MLFIIIANRGDPDQSDLGLHCLSRPFWQVTSIQYFRTYIVYIHFIHCNFSSFFQNTLVTNFTDNITLI